MPAITRDVLYEITRWAPDARTFKAIALTCRDGALLTRRLCDVKMDEFKIEHICKRYQFYTLPNGQYHGKYIQYFDNNRNTIQESITYKNGIRHGIRVRWTYEDPSAINQVHTYVNGKCIRSIELHETGVIHTQKTKKKDGLTYYFGYDGTMTDLFNRVHGHHHGITFLDSGEVYTYYGIYVELPYKYDETPNNDPRCLEFLETIKSFRQS